MRALSLFLSRFTILTLRRRTLLCVPPTLPSLTPSPFAIKLGVALGTHSSPGWLVYLFFFHDSLIPNSARGFHTCPAPAAQRLTLFQAGPPLSSLLPVLRQLPCGSPYSRQVSHSLSHLSRLSYPVAHLTPSRSLTHKPATRHSTPISHPIPLVSVCAVGVKTP